MPLFLRIRRNIELTYIYLHSIQGRFYVMAKLIGNIEYDTESLKRKTKNSINRTLAERTVGDCVYTYPKIQLLLHTPISAH